MNRSLTAVLVAAALTLALAACGDGASSGASTSTAAPALAPVPAPADLALECVVPAPDTTWAKARSQIGGPAAFLPTTAGGLVAVSLHYPLTVSESIDGRVPAVCAATLNGEGVARGVLGVHLRWPDRLLDGLTKGNDARFTVAADPATHIEVLTARDPKDSVYATGVLGNYLLIAARTEDLLNVGPYVARTMPERARDFPTTGVRIAGVTEAPPMDFIARAPATLFSGPAAPAAKQLRSGLERRLTDKLPPDLSFLTERLLTKTAILEALRDADGAELRVSMGDRATKIDLTIPMRKGSAGEASARSMNVGPPTPLLAFPKDTLAAVTYRSASAGDPAESLPTATLIKALGLKEEKDTEQKLTSLVRSFESARGDWTAAGFAFDGTGPSAYLRAAVKDPAALDSALKDLIALADGATPKDPVKGGALKASTGKTVLENIPGDVYRLRLARSAGAAKKGAEPPTDKTETPSAVDLLFRRKDDVFVAATGYASRDALRTVLGASGGESLSQVPEIASPIEGLGSDIAVGFFFDPGRIEASRAGKPGSLGAAPIIVGVGRTVGEGVTVYLKVEANNGAVGTVARWAP